MKQVLYALANMLNELNGNQHRETLQRIEQDLLMATARAPAPKVRAVAEMLTLLADMMPND